MGRLLTKTLIGFGLAAILSIGSSYLIQNVPGINKRVYGIPESLPKKPSIGYHSKYLGDDQSGLSGIVLYEGVPSQGDLLFSRRKYDSGKTRIHIFQDIDGDREPDLHIELEHRKIIPDRVLTYERGSKIGAIQRSNYKNIVASLKERAYQRTIRIKK